MAPSTIQRGEPFPIRRIGSQATLVSIIPSSIRVLIGSWCRLYSTHLHAKKVDIQGSVLWGCRRSHSQITTSKVTSRTCGGIKLTEGIAAIHPYLHHMRPIVFFVFFDRDPELMPNRGIKRNHIGTITLAKINVSRNGVPVELIEAKTAEIGHIVIGVAVGGIGSGGQRKGDGTT